MLKRVISSLVCPGFASLVPSWIRSWSSIASVPYISVQFLNKNRVDSDIATQAMQGIMRNKRKKSRGRKGREVAPLRRTRNSHVAPVLSFTGLIATNTTSKLKSTEGYIGMYLVAVGQRMISTRYVLKIIRMESILLEDLKWAFILIISRP